MVVQEAAMGQEDWALVWASAWALAWALEDWALVWGRLPSEPMSNTMPKTSLSHRRSVLAASGPSKTRLRQGCAAPYYHSRGWTTMDLSDRWAAAANNHSTPPKRSRPYETGPVLLSRATSGYHGYTSGRYRTMWSDGPCSGRRCQSRGTLQTLGDDWGCRVS